MHINGPYDRYPLRETRDLAPPQSTAEDYKRTAAILGLGRCVIVQPSYFAKDNSCTLDSVRTVGLDARAVVVVDPDISEGELKLMHDAGARGIRLQTVVAGGTNPQAARELAARIAKFGWHIQLFFRQSQLEDLIPMIEDLPVPVVIDHMAHLDQMDAPGGKDFDRLLRLMESGQCWIKLSNCFFLPDGSRAKALIRANPDRVVWGTDWPHVAFDGPPPDDGVLLDMLADWAGDADLLARILVHNPARLYFG